MAENITIPELPQLTALNGAVQLLAASGTTDGHTTLSQLTDYMRSQLQPITVAERQLLSNALPDWSGTQQQYNALSSYDAGRWYFITIDDEVQAVYRGEQLITAVPNMVGEFTADSNEDDWYWYPNGVKTPIPVDPSTCRFSYYWPGTLITAERLFTKETVETRFLECKLKRLERMPLLHSANVYAMLSMCGNLEVLPTLDLRGRTTSYVGYLCLPGGPNKVKWKRLAFANTSGVTKWEMLLLSNLSEWEVLTGLDLSSTTQFLYASLALNGMPYVQMTNVGKCAAATTYDFRNKNWGDDTRVRHARKSLVDSLLTSSFDRAAAGYSPLTLQLSPEAYARLTADEVAAITAKGFTLVTA